jgi:hypothetical protein
MKQKYPQIICTVAGAFLVNGPTDEGKKISLKRLAALEKSGGARALKSVKRYGLRVTSRTLPCVLNLTRDLTHLTLYP